jgi:uncharacterized protein (DUF1778 family)
MRSSDPSIPIVIHLNPAQKQMLDRLASDRGLDVGAYLLEIALQASEPDVTESIDLSPADWQILTNTLQSPPAPNAALQKAVNGYGERHPLVKLSGIFKDDPEFEAMMEFIKADRQALDSLWSEDD